MTLEIGLAALLAPLVEGRAFPDVASVNTPRPYITFQQIGGEVVSFLGRDVPTKQNASIQVNVWADTRLSAAAVAESIRLAFTTTNQWQSWPTSAKEATFDVDMQRYGTRQDFTVWYDT